MGTKSPGVRPTLTGLVLAVGLAAGACAPGGGATAAAPVLQTSPDGGFEAEFPGIPERYERPSKSNPDRVLTTYKSIVGKSEIAVSYADYPGRNLSLDRIADGIAEELEGTLESRAAATVMGYPAMDLVLKTDRGTVHERLIVKGIRMYTLLATTRSSRPPAYDHLLATFVLL